MEVNGLSDFVPKHTEILAPGLVSVAGTVAGQPAVWIGSAAQIGCLQFPALEKKQEAPKL